jgi:dihydrofolate reductase
MRTSVFCGISLDGFLARLDGSFDFLDAAGNIPHGFEEFFASIDTLVIGRGTYEVVVGCPEWPYAGKRVVVLSSKPLDLTAARARSANIIEQMSGSPAEIVAKLESTGAQHAYIDGGVTIQNFLRANQIQKLTISRVPVLIGQGIPLFGAVPQDIQLHHIATRTYSTGLVQSEYEVLSNR